MADNRQIKDGLGNLFTVRMRDLSPIGDGTFQRSMVFSQLLPVDYGNGGSYHLTSKSALMAANIAIGAPIYSFLWSSTTGFALIRRVKLQAWSMNVGFTPGIVHFDMVTARAFTAQLTGGIAQDFSTQSGKLRTSMGYSQANISCAATLGLAGGVYTPDPVGVTETWTGSVGNGTYTPVMASMLRLFEKLQGEMPLLLTDNEGFLIRATVPDSGTWSFSIAVEWDEVPPTSSGY